MPAVAEGNVILLGEHPIDIVEACSGLRMLMVFFALAAAFVLLIRRPWPDKVCLLASAVPIALVSNIARIVLTGVLFETGVTSEAVHAFFHDAAGWLMMPFALVLLWAELTVLSHLLIDPPLAPVRTARELGAVRRAPPGPRQARARKAVVREREHEREPSHAAVNPAAEG
jgi:exosortase/archaeosortase family protein